MPLKKLTLKPGVNRENTRYTTENGWYACDKVRFRQGSPEKIGGWSRISSHTFLGICRSLWNWVTISGLNLVGVGTNLKFYLERGGIYYDITPVRATATLTDPFTATDGSSILTVVDVAHGAVVGDFVTYSDGAVVGLGGNITADVLKDEFQIVSIISADSYTIDVGVAANATDAAGSPGGGSVEAAYQINVGPEFQQPTEGWGGGGWGGGAWGVGDGVGGTSSLRLWSQAAFGEDLVFCHRAGQIYYWDATTGVAVRGVLLSSLPGADAEVPEIANFVFVSDVSRFVFAFGCDDYGSSDQDPMLVRWSQQEDATMWLPAATNQAGSLRLSRGSEIVLALQTRQEIFVLTDSAAYSMQYLGPPAVWGAQLLGDNISVISPNAAALGSGVIFWMGTDKFYMYDGRVSTLPCDLLRHVFNDLEFTQAEQVCAGTNEGFNEIWWFYPSAGSTVNDKYVVYNYLDKIWYYGTLGRTAWLDTALRDNPIAATYTKNLVAHEFGNDNNTSGTPAAIEAYVESAEFDIEDGEHFGFVWRLLPDVTFDGSTAASPAATMTLTPLKNSGAGYTSPPSVGGSSDAAVARSATVPIEKYTGQVYIRVRGRQMTLKMESNALGTTWQLGAPRLDIRPDGRR